jgi:hypothetical protein
VKWLNGKKTNVSRTISFLVLRVQKFGHLQDTQQPTECIETDKVVVNQTNRALDPAAIAILSKGLN